MTELAGITRGGALVPEEDWLSRVSGLKSSITVQEDASLFTISSALTAAVRDRVEGMQEPVGLLLSGGLDSTLLCRIATQLPGTRIICYTAGTESSQDMAWAQEAAHALGIAGTDVRTVLLDDGAAERVFISTAAILRQAGINPDAVSVGVGAVLLACAERASADHVHCLMTGGGAEELFAGYERYATAQDVSEACWQGLSSLWRRDLRRDCAISSALGVRLLTPFLDGRMVSAAMALPVGMKLRDGHRKWALRKVAEQAGVPGEFAWRKKVAAQYGSGLDRLMLRLAKRGGMRYRKEYLSGIAGQGPERSYNP